jgi:hypothetical protein
VYSSTPHYMLHMLHVADDLATVVPALVHYHMVPKHLKVAKLPGMCHGQSLARLALSWFYWCCMRQWSFQR